MELDLLNNISRGQNEIDMEEFQRELTNKLEEMESRFTIDRFEGDIAVLENRDTGEMLNVSKKDLPQDAKEGRILKLNKDKYEIDLEEQKIVADRIKNKMKNFMIFLSIFIFSLDSLYLYLSVCLFFDIIERSYVLMECAFM